MEAALKGDVPTSDSDSDLGHLSFICFALAYDRPFFVSFDCLAAAVRAKTGRKVDATNLPVHIKFILLGLLSRFRKRRKIYCMSERIDGALHDRCQR